MAKLVVSTSPHIRSASTTQKIMLDVIIALLPTTIAGAVIFGWQSLIVILSCVASSVLAEYVFNLIIHKKQTVGDLSAVVTGLLLALNLRADTPFWQCIIGSVFAIVVVKCLFGGIGCNFANPAITGRIFMLICFAGTVGGGMQPTVVELTSSATPLEILKGGASSQPLPSLLDMFLGIKGGSIGEVCALAILVGFVYLVVKKVIHFAVPVAFVGTVFVLTLIITNDPGAALYHVLGGGLLLGAVFMATDYATTPLTNRGKVVFAIGCGLITVLIRIYGSYPEGVSFSILIMNILSPYIEKLMAKKPFGGNK